MIRDTRPMAATSRIDYAPVEMALSEPEVRLTIGKGSQPVKLKNTHRVILGNLVLVGWLLLAIYLQRTSVTEATSLTERTITKVHAAAVETKTADH